jgi:hypothetical protein
VTDSSLYCANHPNRETTLRCNRCEKPICAQCAVLTPVGYRCQECVRGQQKVFDNSISIDYPVAAIVSLIGVGIATAVLSYLGFWGLFVAPVVGGGLAEVVRWAVRRRRSRRLPLIAILGGAAGVLIYLVISMIPYVSYFFFSGNLGFIGLGSVLLNFAWPIGYGILILSTMYYRIKGLRF